MRRVRASLNAASVSGKEQTKFPQTSSLVSPTIVLFTLLHSMFRLLLINGHGIKMSSTNLF
jgi:hypothetical protein